MIRQTDAEFPPEWNTWGCLFTAILILAFKALGKELTHEAALSIYQAAKASIVGYLDNGKFKPGVRYDKDGNAVDGMYVWDPIALFALAGYPVKDFFKAPANYKAEPNHLEILHFHRDADTPAGMGNKVHDHFVAGDGNGNVYADPIENSNTVKYGFVENKRIAVV